VEDEHLPTLNIGQRLLGVALGQSIKDFWGSRLKIYLAGFKSVFGDIRLRHYAADMNLHRF